MGTKGVPVCLLLDDDEPISESIVSDIGATEHRYCPRIYVYRQILSLIHLFVISCESVAGNRSEGNTRTPRKAHRSRGHTMRAFVLKIAASRRVLIRVHVTSFRPAVVETVTLHHDFKP